MRIIALLSIFILFLLASCDNELNVIEDRKDIPIVYGFLSASDTAQYIRIEKAFVDAETSALVLAQESDSLYYDDSQLTVEITNDKTGTSYRLDRVDGNLEGFIREEGAFAQSPNYLYKILSSEMVLTPQESYTLSIDRGESFPVVTARTTLVEEPRFITPNPLVATARLDFDRIAKTTFSWSNPPEGFSYVYDVYLDINYTERVKGGNFEPKTLRWQMAKGIFENRIRQDGQGFYSIIEANLVKDTQLERRMTNLDVILLTGNTELLEYIRVGQANLGITSTQDVPTFTNLMAEGEEYGRGIFASRYTKIAEDVLLTNKSIDSLINGSLTKELNFLP